MYRERKRSREGIWLVCTVNELMCAVNCTEKKIERESCIDHHIYSHCHCHIEKVKRGDI